MKIRTRQKLLLLTISTLIFALVKAHAQAWSPNAATIQKLETGIQPSAYPRWGYVDKVPDLSHYARYYAGYKKDGHRLVEGEFVIKESLHESAAGIYIIASPKAFPMIFDGACGIVHVLYDADSAKMLSLTCNGRG